MTYLKEQFDALLEYWPDEDQALRSLRKDAFKHFNKLGFPNKKWEEWKFTNFSGIEKSEYRLSWADDLPQIPSQIPGQISDTHTIFIINGHYQSQLTDIPHGVTVPTGLDHFKSNPDFYALNGSKNPFFALNTSMMNSGVPVMVAPNTIVKKPIQVIYFMTDLSDPLMNHPRYIFEIGENSQVTIIEHYIGISGLPYFVNPVTQATLGQNASLNHIRIQEDDEAGNHTASTHYNLAFDSRLNATGISIGGQLVRHDIQLKFYGDGANATINGLSLTEHNQHHDQHVLVDHQNDACHSRQLFKYILADKSSGVFNGKVIVRKNTKQTDADQSNKNLLLSPTALMNANPQLEIYADDVKCSHGSTTGQIDPEAIFYLCSRGISKRKATELIISGFAKDILDTVNNENVNAYVSDKIENWLERVQSDD